jgi:uncharacterized protein (TIGR03437 family)
LHFRFQVSFGTADDDVARRPIFHGYSERRSGGSVFQKLLLVIPVLAMAWPATGADMAPVLDWYTTAGGSGANSVAAAAADSRGNLYIVGSTTSADFPVVGAAFFTPGGSTLARIDLKTGAGTRLFPGSLPSISAAVADPSHPGTLYAASRNQIWKSGDSGSMWSLLAQFAASVSFSGLAVDPSAPMTLYAGTLTIGLQKSLDGGLNWTAVNSGIPAQQNGSISVGSVEVDPTEPNVIFTGTGYGLMRSADAGSSWTMVGGGNAFSPLVFDALNAGTVYFGSGSDISKSTDHGATFTRISSLPNQAGLIGLTADARHAGILYASSTAGLYRSTDGGISWQLQITGVATAVACDPNSDACYANTGSLVQTMNQFATSAPINLSQPSVTQLVVSGASLFAISNATTDVFAMKLDPDGKIVYSTFFGGSGTDQALALAVGSDGSLYVTGSTNSADLPGTTGAYLSKLPLSSRASTGFVFRLNSAGMLAWATYFPQSGVTSIAVDTAGNPYIAGSTPGGLPTTPGAYQTQFQQTFTSNGFFSVPGPLSAFVTKFNAQGSSLLYSTYIPNDNQKNTVQQAGTLAVDAMGNAWIGVTTGNTIAPPTGTPPAIVKLNSTGSAVLASAVMAGMSVVSALAFDANSNVYIAGSWSSQSTPFPATPGAFQTVPQPVVPMLPYQTQSGGGMDAFVAKWDSSLTHQLAATLLGGEQSDFATSVAVDASGNVIVAGYTSSEAFPTRLPFQESFSAPAGFVAGFDGSLSTLRFSTYLGDGRAFGVTGAGLDGNGRILLAGSTQNSPGTLSGVGGSLIQENLVVANRISLGPAPPIHLDSVENYASHLAAPFTPSETILAIGSGFGTGAQIVVDGAPLTTISANDTSIVAVLPETAATSGAHTVQVSNQRSVSNAVFVPASAASPGIFTVDGSGAGHGYIFNSDGTLNSGANPAAPGSAITILIDGPGPLTFTNGYAEAPEAPAVFVDGFYCAGIAATLGPVMGLPGAVYRLSVYVPDPAVLAQNDPDLKNFQFPAQSSIQVRMGPSDAPMTSQTGVFLNVK